MNKDKNRITVRLSDETIEELRKIGEQEQFNISFIIRTIIKDYIKIYNWKKTKTDE